MNHWRLRIGDRERNEALTILGEHFAEGRLDRYDFDQRSHLVLVAKTGKDLAPLFHDLPGRRPGVLAPLPGRGSVPGQPGHGPPQRSRLPFLPVFVLLLGGAILTKAFWLIPVGLVLWLVLRPSGRGRQRPPTLPPGPHANGS